MKMLAASLSLAVLLSACGSGNKASGDYEQKEKKEKAGKGWVKLFDGTSTKGWHNYGGGAIGKGWVIADGVLTLDADLAKTGGGGNLTTDEEFDNYHLKYDWKISKNGNSGVIFFVHEDPKYGQPYETGPEMQIVDNEGHPDGKIFKHQAGDLYDLIPSSTKTVKPVGEWNTAEIISNKGKLELKLNGTTVVTTTMWDDNWKTLIAGSKFKNWPVFGIYQKGKISLQDHGNTVSFKNIEIKKL